MKKKGKIAMKKRRKNLLKNASRILVFSLICLSLKSCSLIFSDFAVEMNFEYYWDDEKIDFGDLGVTEFTTESGDIIILDDIKFILSQIRLKRDGRGKIYTLEEHKVADQLLRWHVAIGDIPHDDYEISFVFGLQQEYNVQNPSIDLPESFLVPEHLGGGYNFMQLNGRYKNQNVDFQPFEFHVTNAVDTSQPNNIQIEDTSFTVNLGTHSLSGGPFYSIINVEINVAEWFKNPNTWDFSQLNSGLTTNYDAQIMMKENGQNVFSLGRIYAD